MASGVECDSATASLPGVEVAGPSHSQESTCAHSLCPSLGRVLCLGGAWSALARLGIFSGCRSCSHSSPGCHVQAVLGKGDIVPARGLVGCGACLASRALAPRPVHFHVDECALAGARHAPPVPVCCLSSPGRGLRTAPRAVGFTHALGVTVRGLDESTRALRAAAGPVMTARDHTVPVTGERSRNWSLLSFDRSRSWERSRRPRWSCRDRVEAHGSSQDCGNSGLRL